MAYLDADAIRTRLVFDVERLRAAAHRLETVDQGLRALKRDLERRVETLTGEGTRSGDAEIHGSGVVHIRYAQAQAVAQLARRAALGEVLQHSGRLSLIASMAVGRWIAALNELGRGPTSSLVIKGHIDAGRIAYRTLIALRPQDDLRSGCGQLTSAVVVAEFVHADDAPIVGQQIEEGLFRGLRARGMRHEDDVLGAASRALRAGTELLEGMAHKAEPTVAQLLAQADGVEAKVEANLRAPVAGSTPPY